MQSSIFQRRGRQSLLLALLISLFTAAAQPAYAAVIVGDGTPASCTESALRAATNLAGTIEFNCGGPKTITLASPLNIFVNLEIDGGGLITLSGNNATRLFFVSGGSNVTLRNLTLRDGFSDVSGAGIENVGSIWLYNTTIHSMEALSGGGAIACALGGSVVLNNSRLYDNRAGRGGAIFNDGCTLIINTSLLANNQSTTLGGAVYNVGTAYINNSQLTRNQAQDGAGIFTDPGTHTLITGAIIANNSGGHGAGIENSGTLTMTHSLLAGNIASGSGGGLWNLGGAVTVEATSIIANQAFEGAGLNSYGNSVVLDRLTITQNSTQGGPGGGIYFGAGSLFVSNTTINDNQATGVDGSGGGVFLVSDDNSTFYNTTFSGNSAASFGGAIFHRSRYAWVQNATLANNSAGLAGDAIYEDANPTPQNPGVLQMMSSVVYGSNNNCDGTLFETFGYNLMAGTCAALNAATDVGVSDVRMGPLQYNGGQAGLPTILPLPDSPAINMAPTSECTSNDQRGSIRVGLCDSGAVEYGAMVRQLTVPLVIK